MSVREIIEPGKFFHLYNHANGKLELFKSDENYRYFLTKYEKYVYPFVDTFAYCLMPNHFHFAVRIKEQEMISDNERISGSDVYNCSELCRRKVTNGIKNWLISYTHWYNKHYSNMGNLYCQKIRRKPITNEQYLRQLTAYIHLNPVMHGFVGCPADWKYSSYNTLINDQKTLLKRDEIMELFEDISNFEYYHQMRQAEKFRQKSGLTF
jgi:putative transposase